MQNYFPNWNAVIRTPPVRWDADEPPESQYESFVDWCIENDHEEIGMLEEIAYHSRDEKARRNAMIALDNLASEFLERGFCEPEPSGEWDWSPRGW
jgi:hypothetical protein